MSHPWVFLDYGGTLAYADAPYNSASNVWVAAGKKVGIEVDPAKVDAAITEVDPVLMPRIYGYVGRTPEFWHEYHLAVMARLGIDRSRKDLETEVDRIFNDPSRLHLFPETLRTLNGLRQAGFHLGVISNHHDRLLSDLQHLGVTGFFDTITYSQEAGAEKPDPRVFALARRRAGCSPAQAVHVGDSWEADYLGATRAGMRGIWLNRGGSPTRGSCESIRDLGELLPLLARSA